MVKRLLAWAALAYVIVVSAVIYRWNGVSHFLPLDPLKIPNKWRGEARDFMDFCFLLGTWIYPMAIFAIVVLGRYIFAGKSISHRIVAVIACGVAAYLMYWNGNLGVGPLFGD
jgi:hypothetical protein